MERFPISFHYLDRVVEIHPDASTFLRWRIEQDSFDVGLVGKRVRDALMIIEEPPYESEIRITGPNLKGFLKNNTWPAELWWSSWDWKSTGSSRSGAGANGRSIEEAVTAMVRSLFAEDSDICDTTEDEDDD